MLDVPGLQETQGLGVRPDVNTCSATARSAHLSSSVLYDAPQGTAPGTVQSGRRNTEGTGNKGWCRPLESQLP